MKKLILLILLLTTWSLQAQKYAGFRASRILGSFPDKVFPGIDYWASTGKAIADKFNGYSPAGIWIVSLYMDSGESQFNFPSNGYKIPNVSFISDDQNESYLSRFDSEGIKVWLQIEPGAANVDTLIHIVLERYKHHSCIAGFGVDVEWLDPQSDSWGRRVTDAEAARWEAKVKSFNPEYTLFLKHFTKSRMPANYRGNILFVDDSQDFSTSAGTAASSLNYMVSEFKNWGNSFPNNKVAFQYGYSLDEWWWKQYSDPVKTIGDKLNSQVSNCAGLFWVDFTITKLFPTAVAEDEKPGMSGFNLSQNYPNPFNPSTTISYCIPGASYVLLKVYDIIGNEVATIVNEYQNSGVHHAEFSITNSELPSGVYLYRLTAGSNNTAKKFIILK